MGVIGLETFMHNHPECCEPVNIKELAHAYRSKHNKIPELILDIDNCYLRFLYKKPWLSGVQMKELAYMLETFLKKFQSIGIQITAFIGGIVHPNNYKHYRTVFIQKRMREKVNEMFNSLHSNQTIDMSDIGMYYPNNFRRVIIDTFKKCECQIFQSLVKCNKEAAIYSKRNNCFGILAQDSDFIIYNAAKYYFSLINLNLETFDTICYRTDKLAGILKLGPRQLPLWATAIGNAYVYPAALQNFHKSLLEKNEEFSKDKIFFKVVTFLKENVKRHQCLPVQLPELSKKLLGNPNKSYLLHESLESYDIDYPPEDNFMHTNNDYWNRLQKVVIEEYKAARHPYNVYQILFHSFYFQRVDMEDPKKENYQIWCEIAKTLRRKIYGILLYRKCRCVCIKEIHIDSNVQKEEIYVIPIYPEMKVDVLKLWSTEVDDDKWNIFCSSLGIERDVLFVGDRHLIIPVASLNYLMVEHFDIASWEIEAILASILLLQYYSIEDLEAIPELPLDPDGIHLYWYLMKIFDFVTILNCVCGFPLQSDLANPVHYQDGKLFHHKYRQAKENESFENLCEYKEKEIKAGKTIMAMICK